MVAARPQLTALRALDPGVISDLDGVPSDHPASSDLAFHALREYVAGDDLRHVVERRRHQGCPVGQPRRTQSLLRQPQRLAVPVHPDQAGLGMRPEQGGGVPGQAQRGVDQHGSGVLQHGAQQCVDAGGEHGDVHRLSHGTCPPV